MALIGHRIQPVYIAYTEHVNNVSNIVVITILLLVVESGSIGRISCSFSFVF